MKKSPKRQNFDQSGHPGPEINFFNFNFFSAAKKMPLSVPIQLSAPRFMSAAI
jgi:hypothetical protein